MNLQNRIQRLLKFRFAILYPFGVMAVLFSIPTDSSIRAGIGFVVLGLFIRIWANGYAIKLDKLTTSGPYAFVRHPLYLGTVLLAIGFTIILRISYMAGGLFILLIIAVYYRTIKKEDLMLEDKFKNEYTRYRNKVPAILPTIFPYTEGEKWVFSFKRLIKSQEYKLFIWVIVLLIIFHLKDELIIEREKMDARIWQLIIGAFILGLLDLVGEIIKFKKKKI